MPSVVSEKLAINTVEFNSRKVFSCPFIVFVEPIFSMQCVNGQSFFIFDVRTDSCFCRVLNCYFKMLEILLF